MRIKSPDTLILSDDLAKIWQDRDVFDAVQALEGDVARALEGRETIRVTINGQVYYRKLHTGIGWREIFKNLVRMRLPILGARTEWDSLARLHAVGIPTLEAVGFGERGCNPAKQLSFLITRELANTQELDHFLREYLARGETLSFAARRQLIAQLAQIARTLHGIGVNHRDFYLCHFLLDLASVPEWLGGGSAPLLYLVDLHRAQHRALVPFRWRVKDLASVYFSAMDLPLTRGDRLRFLADYFQCPVRELLRTEAKLLRATQARAEQLYRREQRLIARGERH